VPNVVVIAGPNGAGKSTAAPLFLRDRLHIDEFVNADVILRRYERGIRNFVALCAPIADSWEIHENTSHARLIAKKEEGATPQVVDEGVWLMIEKQAKARQRAEHYEAEPTRGGIMGVPFEQIMEALREAGREARRRHKALGHPIVIWRDGRVVEVPPEEIEV
jgi:hypothetical protein